MGNLILIISVVGRAELASNISTLRRDKPSQSPLVLAGLCHIIGTVVILEGIHPLVLIAEAMEVDILPFLVMDLWEVGPQEEI